VSVKRNRLMHTFFYIFSWNLSDHFIILWIVFSLILQIPFCYFQKTSQSVLKP
jgi:hypothetical protein